MIYKSVCDIKKGEDIYICDKCEKQTEEPHPFKDNEFVYCKKCYDYQCDMGDLAADAALEREQEEKWEKEHPNG